jgi:hypothetical protein
VLLNGAEDLSSCRLTRLQKCQWERRRIWDRFWTLQSEDSFVERTMFASNASARRKFHFLFWRFGSQVRSPKALSYRSSSLFPRESKRTNSLQSQFTKPNTTVLEVFFVRSRYQLFPYHHKIRMLKCCRQTGISEAILVFTLHENGHQQRPRYPTSCTDCDGMFPSFKKTVHINWPKLAAAQQV